jgi:hypothetical protein
LRHQRIAIRRRTRHSTRSNIAAGAGAILNDELLSELFRKFLSDQAGENVAWAAGCERHDHPHRPIRIDAFAGLPLCRAGDKQRQADQCSNPFVHV